MTPAPAAILLQLYGRTPNKDEPTELGQPRELCDIRISCFNASNLGMITYAATGPGPQGLEFNYIEVED